MATLRRSHRSAAALGWVPRQREQRLPAVLAVAQRAVLCQPDQRHALDAVGLGKGAIPTVAAVNWVLKDGLGYLSKIMLSKFSRHFDVNPKGWRLFVDLLKNTAYGLEILTPVFPHLFVPTGAAAGAGRSAAAFIQAATRSCFYAGFVVQKNFAEVKSINPLRPASAAAPTFTLRQPRLLPLHSGWLKIGADVKKEHVIGDTGSCYTCTR